MPVRKTNKGWYWENKGPFPTKKKAEEIQKAAYSSYREVVIIQIKERKRNNGNY